MSTQPLRHRLLHIEADDFCQNFSKIVLLFFPSTFVVAPVLWHFHSCASFQGYILAMKNRKKELPISAGDLETLFANIKDIYAFNR